VAIIQVVKSPEETAALEAKLCETFLTLGEVSLESENYEQAVADITECLNMRKVGAWIFQKKGI
jgi:hypothetical protein